MSPRLLVVGDTLLDRDVIGRVERMCPDAPAPVVDVTGVHDRAGGAGLAAVLAAGRGAQVVLATGLGRDGAGQRVRELLDGVVQVHDVLSPATTPGKTRVRVAGNSLARLDDHGHLLGMAADGGRDGYVGPEVRDRNGGGGSGQVDGAVDGDGQGAGDGDVDVAALDDLLSRSDAVLVADYGGRVTAHPAVRELLTRYAADIPVVWDPHPRGRPPVPGVAAVTPNRAEALHFARAGEHARLDTDQPETDQSGAEPSEHQHDQLAQVARLLRERWSAGSVVVTDGAAGAVIALPRRSVRAPVRRPAPAGVDPCGAGDRFAGSLALALTRGADVPVAVRQAVRDVGAWLTAGGVAGQGPTVLDQPAPGEEPGASDDVIRQVRTRGGTVVATGGCFDVLHVGHLALLEAARREGDCLVVLLNSDGSVRRLKGSGRPVHAVADRARLLQALACVDAVVVFDGADPAAALARLRPDVWVKGEDYRGRRMAEAEVVERYGGRVVLAPLVDGHSTTRILRHGSAGRGSDVMAATS